MKGRFLQRVGHRLAGPAIFGAMALAVSHAVVHPSRSVRANELHRTGQSAVQGFEPAAFIPQLAEARSEPSSPHRSFARLPPVHVVSLNSGEQEDIRLYDYRGEIREEAIDQLDRLLCDASKPDDLRCASVEPRTIQLMFRAAYRFGKGEIVIVSGYRDPKKHDEGYHSQGRAIDFRLTGVKLTDLAAYVRSFPRVGVGVYTHPRTQYVHLDSREHSYHWGDASGPGIPGGEWSLGGQDRFVKLDASYSPSVDWPEKTVAPARASQ